MFFLILTKETLAYNQRKSHQDDDKNLLIGFDLLKHKINQKYQENACTPVQ